MEQKKPKRVGRPEGHSNLSDQILDVAEVLFAEQGYSGTKLRQVASGADVNSAMTAYYFKNKTNLFREVFLRRGNDIARQRMEMLERLRKKADYTVEDLVRGFLTPSAELRVSEQGRAFLRLQARLHMEPETISYALRKEVYDESTRAYAQAFMRLIPTYSEAKIFQKITLLVGAYLYAFSDTNRLEHLAGGKRNVAFDDLFETTVAFVVAGFLSEV